MIACLLSLTLVPNVAPIPIEDLVKGSETIALARVTSVEVRDGYKIATAVPIQNYKGAAKSLTYFASRTWTCDTSNAIPGESVMLFLRPSDELVAAAYRHLPSIAHSGRGRMVLTNKLGQIAVDPFGVEFPDRIAYLKFPRGKSDWATFRRFMRFRVLETEVIRHLKLQKIEATPASLPLVQDR